MDNVQLVRRALDRAHGLIEKGWVQGMGATDSRGNEVYWVKREAVCFCLWSAVRRSCSDIGLESISGITGLLVDKAGGIGLVGWNDNPKRTKEEVLGLLASARAELN